MCAWKFNLIATVIFSGLYFLVHWLDEEDDDLYDVVPSRSVVPPEGLSIFGVAEGTICRVAFDGQYYRAEVVNLGELCITYLIL